ncbi:MAG TPA: hypothetical protein DCZ94_01330 [Lentisphaeria bacterium]|nr:MAG: hypothetical protein A2X48_11450 [Lentisphaerae bacterium GWF2_49_21]HBC85573.1 hypothetical protein [Lentisphaeria bacterium]
MPHTVNGIGTGYFGSRNRIDFQGVCEFCENEVKLSSYDTTLYFVVFFIIPLIPLKKLRILLKCPHCGRHRALSLRDWEDGRREALEKIRKEIESDRFSEDDAFSCISTLIEYQAVDSLTSMSPGLHELFKENPDVLALLARGHAYFGQNQEAEKLFRESLELKEVDGVKESLAVVLMRLGRPEEAEKYLQHVFDQEISDRIGCLYQLARAYQAQGKHGETLDVLDKCVSIMPSLAEDTYIKRLRTISEKNRNTAKPVKAYTTQAGCASSVKSRDIGGLIAKLAGLIILLLILAIYLLACFADGTNKDVVLVNGINKDYSFLLNKKEYKLSALGHRRIQLPEGRVDLEPVGSSPCATATFEISVPFFIRPFVKRTFVINPDGVCVILKEKGYYAKNADKVPQTEYSFYAGNQFQVFKGIDYPFKDFPEKLTVSSKETAVSRTGISSLSKYLFGPGSGYYWETMEKDLGAAKMQELASKMIRIVPESEGCLDYLYAESSPEQFTNAVSQLTVQLPAIIPLHRLYQESMKKLGKKAELLDKYGKLHQENPSDNSITYLYARILDETRASDELFLKSVQGENPCPYSYFALAYRGMARADFHNAAEMMANAIRLDPGNEGFRVQRLNALLAAQEYDTLFKEISGESKDLANLFSFETLCEMSVYVSKSEPDKAKAAYEKRLEKMPKDDTSGKYFSAQLAYMKGDKAAFSEYFRAEKSPVYKFMAEFTAGNLDEAVKSMGDDSSEGLLFNNLLMYLEYLRRGDKTRSETFKKEAVRILSYGDADERLMAEYIEGRKKVEMEKVHNAVLDVTAKVPLMLALAESAPEKSAELRKFAGRLNYGRLFPSLYIRELIGK